MFWLGVFLVGICIYYPVADAIYLKKDLTKIQKIQMYKSTIRVQWLFVLVMVLIWFLQGLDFSQLVTFPAPTAISLNTLTPFTKGVLSGLLGGVLIFIILILVLSKRKKNTPIIGDIDFLIPQTKKERIWFFFLSATAGICEELIFRGAMVYFLFHLPLDLPLWAIGLIASAAFGIVHLYQGFKGVIATGIGGYIFFGLYMLTGSLWVPILLHFIIDVKLVFMPNKVSTPTNEYSSI